MTMVLKPQQVYRVKKAMQIKFVLEYTAFLGDESVRVEPGLLFCYVGRSLGSNTFVPVGEGHADYEQGRNLHGNAFLIRDKLLKNLEEVEVEEEEELD